MANQPAAKYRVGFVTATVWENNGFYSVKLTVSYKNDNGEWKESSSLSHADVLNAIKALERAEEFIALR